MCRDAPKPHACVLWGSRGERLCVRAESKKRAQCVRASRGTAIPSPSWVGAPHQRVRRDGHGCSRASLISPITPHCFHYGHYAAGSDLREAGELHPEHEGDGVWLVRLLTVRAAGRAHPPLEQVKRRVYRTAQPRGGRLPNAPTTGPARRRHADRAAGVSFRPVRLRTAAGRSGPVVGRSRGDRGPARPRRSRAPARAPRARRGDRRAQP